MAKFKKIIVAGPLVVECVYPAPNPRDSVGVRAGKKALSSEAQRRMNLKYAYQKLELEIAANFGIRDLYVTLTYDDAHLPRNRTEARKVMQDFWRRLRKIRREKGQELRYLYVTEHKHGEGRWHHHALINATGEDYDLIRRLWGQGSVEFKQLRIDRDKNFETLSRYLCKEQRDKVGQRLWSGSRNLHKPERECFRVPNDMPLSVPKSAALTFEDTGDVTTAYAWIFRDPSSGAPRELIPLPPDHVTIRVDLDGHLWYFFSHPITGEVTMLRPEDVLHYKAYSEDGIEGISILKRASMTLSTARAAQQYENSTWLSGGQPCGVLTTESDLGDYDQTLTDGTVVRVDPKAKIRESWEAVHRGPGNAFRLAVLDLGLKYQPISMSNTDAQFVESNEVRVADVCRFFGVPLHLAYAGKQSYQSNEQNGIEYVNYTLLGYETQWGQEDSYKLLLPGERAKHLRIKRELKVFLRGDTAAQAAWYRALRELGGLNANEIRALEDMDAIPGGDTYYASWNYGPLDQWALLSVIRALGKTVLEPPKKGENSDG